MPFDYEGAKAAGYSDAEIQGFLSGKPPTVMPAPPTNIPYASNPSAAQKFQESYNQKAGENAAATEFKANAKQQILNALNPVEKGADLMNKEGGYSPLYKNESLLFGVAPGVKPTIEFLQSQGMADLPIVGDVGHALANRTTQEASIGTLRSMLKNAIRSPGEGTFSDSDQALLDKLLPSGSSYEADKRIIDGLRNGALLNDLEAYRNSDAWKKGLPKDTQAPVATPQPSSPSQNNAVVDYREYFK